MGSREMLKSMSHQELVALANKTQKAALSFLEIARNVMEGKDTSFTITETDLIPAMPSLMTSVEAISDDLSFTYILFNGTSDKDFSIPKNTTGQDFPTIIRTHGVFNEIISDLNVEGGFKIHGLELSVQWEAETDPSIRFDSEGNVTFTETYEDGSTFDRTISLEDV